MGGEGETGPDSGANQLKSITKKIQLKSRGKVFGVVRENYLRTDVPCRSPLCFDSCSHLTDQMQNNQNLSVLPQDVTHYIIPAVDVASKFMEIFELNELSMSQTISRLVHDLREGMSFASALIFGVQTFISHTFPQLIQLKYSVSRP